MTLRRLHPWAPEIEWDRSIRHGLLLERSCMLRRVAAKPATSFAKSGGTSVQGKTICARIPVIPCGSADAARTRILQMTLN